MDWKEASRKVGAGANSARRWSATALDSLAPTCAPFAARWDAEADRRRQLRTPEHLKALITAQREHNSARVVERQAAAQRRIARKESKNPLSSVRRAARTADKAARSHRQAAKADLKSAKANYPDTLTRVAVKAHAAHSVPAAVASVALSTPQDWTMWPASVSAALIGLNAGVLWLGRRKVVTVMADDGASLEERQLLERLDPAYWVEHASERGLGGTVTGTPQLGDAGITCAVRLDGQWDVAKLRASEDQVRALLGCRTALRIGIAKGERGGWAELTFRTRSAVDGADMLWTPERQGVGLDTVTGELVSFSPYSFRLVAGATGMGKSVLLRPGMAEVLARPDAAVVYLDPKHQEFRLWGGKMRVEHEMPAIYEVTGDLVGEMERRQRESTGTTWTPTPEAPELVVIVDEGAAIVRASKQKAYGDFLDMFEALATMGRAAKIWLTWATQYPTKEAGIPAQVVEMMLDRAALSVESATADRTIFGENAAAKGYTPSELGGVPGLAMVRTKGRKSPAPVQTWYLDDERAAKLPKGIVWQAPDSDDGKGQRPALTLVKPPLDGVPAPRAADAATQAGKAEAPKLTDSEAKVLRALVDAGEPQRHRDLVQAAGMAKATVSKAVAGLIGHGLVVRDGQTYAATDAAGEVSA